MAASESLSRPEPGVWARSVSEAGVNLGVEAREVLTNPRFSVGRLDPAALAAYREVAAELRTRYWHSGPLTLLTAARAHLALGESMLRDAQENSDLAGAVAESALLVARLAFFDLPGHQQLAGEAFEIATRAATSARDHSLAAAVAAHRAFVPGFAGDVASAQGFLNAANMHFRRSDRSPAVLSWLHCVNAEVLARSDDGERSMYHVRQAQDSLSQDRDSATPVWLDFYDGSRWAGFAGNTALLAGRQSQAREWLKDAVEHLREDATKQRSVLLLDLAVAHARDNPEHAVTLAVEACDQLEASYYRTAVERIPAVQRALSGSRHAVTLGDRARALFP